MSERIQDQGVQFRRLTESDIQTYHDIRLSCLQAHPNSFGSTYEEEIKKKDFKFDGYLREGHQENFLLGVFAEGNCVGICGFIKEEGIRTKHRGHLVQIYVRKAFQGKGIGREMISRTIDQAFDHIGLEQILLGVITENDQANHLYETLGFQEYGRIKQYLKVKDGYLDKRLMIKYKEQNRG